ncbi:ABC transporter, substrate-binding protein [Desulfosarcina variabilis str. Montpellier]|uniref:ABC transporter substrate-binding protein n=1 Tax=Desulfosarcina variabilis TaxID=2300 RepID=UPI003AFA39BD
MFRQKYKKNMRTLSRYVSIGIILMVILLTACSKGEKTYRVGILTFKGGSFIRIAEGFKKKMADLGYVEGRNIVYDVQFMQFDPEMDRQTLTKFIGDKVDLVFSFPTEPTATAKAILSGTGIPVLFALAGIEGTDLVENIRQPGNGITGVRTPAVDTTLKRLEFLKELKPSIKRVLILYNPEYPLIAPTLEKLRPLAKSLEITLVEKQVDTPQAVQTALQKRSALEEIGVDAILDVPDGVTHTSDSIKAIIQFGKQHKIPFAATGSFEEDQGATFSYGPDFFDAGTLAAALAHKIFQGIPAGTIPVATPEAHLKIDIGALKQTGLTPSKGMMAMATKIVD